MRLLLLGAEGQLGRHLGPRLASGELVSSGRTRGDRPCDLADAKQLSTLLNTVQPEVVINAAAWTAVDAAEDQPQSARLLNTELPDKLAGWCQRHDALLVHYSTDYVFDGHPGRAWREDDETAPASVYGRTKLDGELAIRASGARALILRTAWLYSTCPGNFLSAILARAARGEPLRVVSDQYGSPTWAGSLAAITVDLLERLDPWRDADPRVRVLHAADRGSMSWHEFAAMAVHMAAECGLIEQPVDVTAIASDQWPQKAARPSWSVLDVSALEALLDRATTTTRQALEACLKQWNWQ